MAKKTSRAPEKFSLTRDGLTIRGKAYLPDTAAGKLPAIIISHEFGLSMHSTARYAKRLYSEGYAVFIYDFCGSGVGKSDGDSARMSVLTETRDLCAVMDYVKALEYIDSARLVLMGCSQGGLVTALVAAKRCDEVQKMILYYPALSIPDDARRGNMLGAKFSADSIPKKFRALYVQLGECYIKDALSLEPWREICSFAKPVLVVHGSDDGIVNVKYARLAKAKYPDCEYAEIEKARHLFLGGAARRALEITKKFLLS